MLYEVITDTAARLQACVQRLLTLDPAPDLVVMTGDLTDLGRPEEYAHLRQLLAPLPQPILAVPGNHDARDSMRDAFAHQPFAPDASTYLQFVQAVGSYNFV